MSIDLEPFDMDDHDDDDMPQGGLRPDRGDRFDPVALARAAKAERHGYVRVSR